MNVKSFITETIETIITSVIVLLIIYSTIALPEVVLGSSMEPNFHTGERILVDRWSKYLKLSFDRGEIVVFKPETGDKHLIKRVIGLPGDIFKIYDCKVFITRDDQRYVLDEFYLANNTCTLSGSHIQAGRSFKISDNEYVVLGDNRGVSLDSRTLGLVKKSDIIGRVSFRFWPLDKIGFVK